MNKYLVLLSLITLIGQATVKSMNFALPATGETTPILSVTPQNGDFGGQQLGLTSSISFTIKNTGVSILKIKKIEISGVCFTLTDTNSYPFEVVADTGFSLPEGNSGKSLKFMVNFKPTDIGEQSGKVMITYGLYSDQTYDIPLSGEGLSCYTAIVANKGENWSQNQDSWYKYTADKFSIVEINTCHPHNAGLELYLYVYSNCTGTLIGAGWETMDYCDYQGAVIIQTVLNAGETIYIFWPRGFTNSVHPRVGFFFNIKATYPIDGDVCENAVPLTLPVINHFGNTRGLNDDYNYSPCSPFSNFMGGNDKVYTITLPEDGYLTGDITGAYGSIHILDECPKEELAKDQCKAFAGGPEGGHFRRKISAGTYFCIISNWPPPNAMDYLLNLTWEGVSVVENDQISSSLNVYPNPARDRFTVSITQEDLSDLTLELFNLSGQIVYSNQVKAVFSYQTEIDAGTLSRGVYYLKVCSGKEVNIKKIVIE